MTATHANDNRAPAAPGFSFCPELGERHDGRALFVTRTGRGGYTLSWSPGRHDEALEAFRQLRIRPRFMELTESIRGGRKWGACVTWGAGNKLMATKCAVLESLLD